MPAQPRLVIPVASRLCLGGHPDGRSAVLIKLLVAGVNRDPPHAQLYIFYSLRLRPSLFDAYKLFILTVCAESFMQFLISHFIHFALYCNVSRSDSGEEEIGIKSRRICAAVHIRSISDEGKNYSIRDK